MPSSKKNQLISKVNSNFEFDLRNKIKICCKYLTKDHRRKQRGRNSKFYLKQNYVHKYVCIDTWYSENTIRSHVRRFLILSYEHSCLACSCATESSTLPTVRWQHSFCLRLCTVLLLLTQNAKSPSNDRQSTSADAHSLVVSATKDEATSSLQPRASFRIPSSSLQSLWKTPSPTTLVQDLHQFMSSTTSPDMLTVSNEFLYDVVFFTLPQSSFSPTNHLL